MSAANNIEAMSVFVMVDGRLCLAPIPAESAPLLVGLIAPLQDGQPRETKLVVMPPSVTNHVEAAGKALRQAIKTQGSSGARDPAGTVPDTAEVVSAQALQAAFRNTNFGTTRHRELLHVAVLKKACGYHCGHTITSIMQELGLIGVRGTPTKKGRRMLQIAFHQTMLGGP